MEKKLVNLGCGNTVLPGFINVDLDSMPHVDHVANIKELPFFEDNTIDLFYCSHSLEYFDRVEVKQVLREWYRKLKPGGCLRVAVPDFKAISEIYLESGDLDGRGILGPLYGRWPLASNNEEVFFHKSTYDFISLEKLLLETGFKDVRHYDWRNTIHKDYDDYSQAYIPHMDKVNGKLISLNVEAIK